ncbi:unnamed protein product, partial [Rotaria sordida]
KLNNIVKEDRSSMYYLLTNDAHLDHFILFDEHLQVYQPLILVYLQPKDYEKALKTLQ